MSAGDDLATAHKTAARATGLLSGMLAMQKIRRADLQKCVEHLRSAADAVEQVILTQSSKTG